jgi:uncharacterized membrane protein
MSSTSEHRNARQSAEQLAQVLGWFSVGLGLAELAAPRAVSQLIGLPKNTSISTLRAFGVREIGNGIAILSQPANSAWLWSRVGGDALDLSWLASAGKSDDADRGRLSVAMAAVLGVTALDVLAAQQLTRGGNGAATSRPARARSRQGVRIERAITVNRPVSEVYQFWHQFENLPRFMRHLESVETLAGGRSRWRAKGPAGMVFEWEAEIVQDRADEWIAWRSLEGSDVDNSGSVRFMRAPGGRGTEIHVQLQYAPPAGRIGRTIAKLFGEEPEQQIADDLRRFKQLMETGEIPISEGPALWRSAQPPASREELLDLAGVK